MNKKWLIPIPIILAVVLFFLFRKSQVETVKPQRKSITEAVYASGFIVPRNEYKLFALADGYITAKSKEAGDDIKKGEVILQVQNDASSAKLGASSAAYDFARWNASDNSPMLLELGNKVKSAQAKYRTDSTNYMRYKNMFDSQAITKAQLDQALLAFEVSGNDYNSAREMLEKTKQQLQVELRNAQSAVVSSGQEAGNYTVRSLIDGVVFDLTKELGETVRRNEMIGIVGEKGTKILELSVDQSDIAKIKTGQMVVVKMDVSGNQIFNAKVTRIYPNMNQNDQSFKVEAEFTEPYEFNFVHASVEANIIISQKDNALLIPKGLIQAGEMVEVKGLGMNKTIKVRRGIENLEFVEVLEGVSDSDELVVPKK